MLRVASSSFDMTTAETTAEDGASARLSVIVPTFDQCPDPAKMLAALKAGLEGIARPHEILLVGGSGTRDRVRAAEAELGAKDRAGDWARLIPVETSIAPEEETALKLALSRAEGDLVLTLPGWRTPGPKAFAALFAALDGSGDADGDGVAHDFVTGTELDPAEAPSSSWRRRLFAGSVEKLFGTRFHDLFCRVRLGHRKVFEETAMLGVRQHFVPVVADWRGFDVAEVYLPPRTDGGSATHRRGISLTGHFRAMVDLLMLYVVLKFLHRPLRFFSAIGAPLVLIGTLVTGYLVIARLLQMTALVDRPLLTFGVLAIVLGVQVIAIGLIGEIVVYTSHRRAKTYEVDRIAEGDGERPAGTR